jgi:hypothetical protein
MLRHPAHHTLVNKHGISSCKVKLIMQISSINIEPFNILTYCTLEGEVNLQVLLNETRQPMTHRQEMDQ